MSCQFTRPYAHCTYVPSRVVSRHHPACDNSSCVQKNGEVQVKVRPGGHYVGYGNLRITTTLGSCIAACVRDPFSGVGGLNHFLLPEGCDESEQGWNPGWANRYGVHAMETLLNEVIKRGGNRSRLEIKVFGGGHVLRDSASDVGARNVLFIRRYLETEGMRICASDLGGYCSRRLIYDVNSGRVQLKRMSSTESQRIRLRDRAYILSVDGDSTAGEVELFD